MSETERTGRRRNRRPTEQCDRKPGRELPPATISPACYDVRLLTEAMHDVETLSAAAQEARFAKHLAELAAEHAGRCCGCGERIGDVYVCPVCHTYQAKQGRQNAGQRKTIGGFCAPKG